MELELVFTSEASGMQVPSRMFRSWGQGKMGGVLVRGGRMVRSLTSVHGLLTAP